MLAGVSRGASLAAAPGIRAGAGVPGDGSGTRSAADGPAGISRRGIAGDGPGDRAEGAAGEPGSRGAFAAAGGARATPGEGAGAWRSRPAAAGAAARLGAPLPPAEPGGATAGALHPTSDEDAPAPSLGTGAGACAVEGEAELAPGAVSGVVVRGVGIVAPDVSPATRAEPVPASGADPAAFVGTPNTAASTSGARNVGAGKTIAIVSPVGRPAVVALAVTAPAAIAFIDDAVSRSSVEIVAAPVGILIVSAP